MPRKKPETQKPSMRWLTELPTGDDEALVKAVNRAVASNSPARMRARAKNQLVEAWLAGARRFPFIDYESGTLGEPEYHDTDNPLAFALNLTSVKCSTEYARLSGQDLSPSVTQLENSLSGLRKASSLQVALDNVCAADRMATAHRSSRLMSILIGCVGLRPIFSEGPDGSLQVEADVIRGEELGPVPANRPFSECDGITRTRTVTVAWLEAQGLDVPKGESGLKKMRASKVPYGEGRNDATRPFSGGGAGSSGAGVSSRDASWHVELHEYWEKGPQKSLVRYVAIAGDALLADVHYGAEWMEAHGAPTPPAYPVSVANYSSHLNFHGRGKAELLIPMERMTEETLYAASRNVKEYDAYGTLFLPGSMGAAVEGVLKDVGNRGPKIATYDPQPGMQSGGIVPIAPKNAGTMPATISQLFHGIFNEIAGQSPLLQGVGPSRVGEPGLNQLFQMSNIALDAPAGAQAEMWADFNRAVAFEIKLRFRPGDSIRLNTVDDSVCGIVIDPRTLAVSLSPSSLPWPNEVAIGVKGAAAVDKEAELQKAIALRNAGMVNDLEFWVWVFRRRLPLDGPKRREQNAVEQGQLQHQLLFGDGETPAPGGGIHVHAEDAVEVYQYVLNEFRTRAEFKFAGDAVKKAFAQYDALLKALRPTGFPSQMPNMEQAAQADQDVAARMAAYMAGKGPEVS